MSDMFGGGGGEATGQWQHFNPGAALPFGDSFASYGGSLLGASAPGLYAPYTTAQLGYGEYNPTTMGMQIPTFNPQQMQPAQNPWMQQPQQMPLGAYSYIPPGANSQFNPMGNYAGGPMGGFAPMLGQMMQQMPQFQQQAQQMMGGQPQQQQAMPSFMGPYGPGGQQQNQQQQNQGGQKSPAQNKPKPTQKKSGEMG